MDHARTAPETGIELVRRALARLAANDPNGTVVLCHPSFHLSWTRVGRMPRAHEGPQSLGAHLADLERGWESVLVSCERVREMGAGDDRVLAYYTVEGHGPHDVVAHSRHAALVRTRDGRLAHWEAFEDVVRSWDWHAAEAQRGGAATA